MDFALHSIQNTNHHDSKSSYFGLPLLFLAITFEVKSFGFERHAEVHSDDESSNLGQAQTFFTVVQIQ